MNVPPAGMPTPPTVKVTAPAQQLVEKTQTSNRLGLDQRTKGAIGNMIAAMSGAPKDDRATEEKTLASASSNIDENTARAVTGILSAARSPLKERFEDAISQLDEDMIYKIRSHIEMQETQKEMDEVMGAVIKAIEELGFKDVTLDQLLFRTSTPPPGERTKKESLSEGAVKDWLTSKINGALISLGVPEEQHDEIENAVFSAALSGELGDGTPSEETAQAIADMVTELAGTVAAPTPEPTEPGEGDLEVGDEVGLEKDVEVELPEEPEEEPEGEFEEEPEMDLDDIEAEIEKLAGGTGEKSEEESIQEDEDSEEEPEGEFEEPIEEPEVEEPGDMKTAVIQFFLDNPAPDDEVLHAWAEEQGYNVDDVEEIAYQLASKQANLETGGKAPEAGVGEENVDPDELAMGIEVEKEHTSDEEIAKKIALDHLAEIPDYYTRLKAMEAEAGVEKESVQEQTKQYDPRLINGTGKHVHATVQGVKKELLGMTSYVGTRDEMLAITFDEESSAYPHGKEINIHNDWTNEQDSFDGEDEVDDAIITFLRDWDDYMYANETESLDLSSEESIESEIDRMAGLDEFAPLAALAPVVGAAGSSLGAAGALAHGVLSGEFARRDKAAELLKAKNLPVTASNVEVVFNKLKAADDDDERVSSEMEQMRAQLAQRHGPGIPAEADQRKVPGKRDGTGPAPGSYRREKGLKGRRKAAGQKCPYKPGEAVIATVDGDVMEAEVVDVHMDGKTADVDTGSGELRTVFLDQLSSVSVGEDYSTRLLNGEDPIHVIDELIEKETLENVLQ